MCAASIDSASTLPHCTHTQSSSPLPRNAGRSGSSWIAVPAAKGTSPSRISRITTRATGGSDLAELGREIGDQAVQHADHHALAHRGGLAGDLRSRVDRAAAVVELERDVGVRMPRAARLARLDLHYRATRGRILLDELDRADHLHRHRAHLEHDLRLDGAGPGPLDHAPALYGGNHAL